jgi:iron complex outermembrane receptor protein
MEVRTFETKFFWEYGEALTKGSVNYNHLQSDGFRQNSSYDRKSLTLQGQQKINAKGELSFIYYTQLKAYIPSSINEDDFNNHPEKPHAIGLRLRAMNPMTN